MLRNAGLTVGLHCWHEQRLSRTDLKSCAAHFAFAIRAAGVRESRPPRCEAAAVNMRNGTCAQARPCLWIAATGTGNPLSQASEFGSGRDEPAANKHGRNVEEPPTRAFAGRSKWVRRVVVPSLADSALRALCFCDSRWCGLGNLQAKFERQTEARRDVPSLVVAAMSSPRM